VPFAVPPAITTRKPISCERVKVNWEHPLNRGLIALWLLNESSGTITRDTANPGRNIFDDFTGAYLNSRGLVNANNQWATCNSPTISAIGTGPFCLIIELTLSSLANATGLLSFGSYAPAWAVNSTGALYVYIGSPNTPSTGAMVAGQRTIVVFNRWDSISAVGLEYYINGVEAGATALGGSIGAPAAINIGADRDSNAGVEAQGVFHHIELFNRRLFAEEIKQISAMPYGTPDNPRLI
jgi:hypothetical protein